MNWGWKIAIVYSLFVVGMLGLVVAANRQTNDLVTEDYYAKELAYQDVIEARTNAQALEQPMRFVMADGARSLDVHFPPSAASPAGELHFYRPSDASLDVRVPVLLGEGGIQTVDLSAYKGGFWRLSVQWETAATPYFAETTLNLP
jgi:hypothetical protein